MTDRAVIIATGPSLTADDVAASHALNRTTYVVNDAYKLCPWADVLYACDGDWWDHHERATRHIPERWTCDKGAAERYRLRYIAGEHHENARTPFVTLETYRRELAETAGARYVVYGGNSGFQTIGLAYWRGIRDAVLLGFDMEHEPGTKKHFFGEHPSAIDRHSPFGEWVENFTLAAPVMAKAGLRIVNASRRTALECFPRVTIEECN